MSVSTRASDVSSLGLFGKHLSRSRALAVLQAVHFQPSPFTEKDSLKKSQGTGFKLEVPISQKRASRFELGDGSRLDSQKLDNNAGKDDEAASSSVVHEDNDIAARLPELREVLGLLKKQRQDGGKSREPGNVFLVGTGPGDPELLTLKAVRLMQTADLVLYDRLVSADILDMVHDGARLLYVGKTSGYHSRTQDEIHELLLSSAEAGATVVRLKGGDPLVFGRGGEEVEFLQRQGISVTVVPGITAASGIAAQLGIPLTHRGVANSLRFLTGHARKGGTDPMYVAGQAADPDSTLVVYMGLATLPALAEKLITNGLPPDTPSVAVERGTTAQQRTVFSDFIDLPNKVEAARLISPTLILIGQVVSLSPFWPKTLNIDKAAESSVPEPRDRRARGPDPALPSQSLL